MARKKRRAQPEMKLPTKFLMHTTFSAPLCKFNNIAAF